MGRKVKETPVRYCQYCGEKLERKVFSKGRLEDIAAFCKRKYCNRECMRKDWLTIKRNNQNYRSAHATSQKINELILQEHACELCGSTQNLDVHHIDENYHNNEITNLMVLCRGCHMKQHKSKSKCIICGQPVKGHGYCNKHYIRYKKYGDPLHISQNSKTNSKGETKISKLLEENNISFLHDKSIFKDCILFTGGVARFDFYVNDTYIIEYDSEMHYKYTKSGWYTKEEYEVTKQRDMEKNEYCWGHNIPIIRIPYWEYDNISIDDLKLETTRFLCTKETINRDEILCNSSIYKTK